ncbi:MAG: adenosylcobinamide-phosphate synthase CbiB [Solirubrobacteraceae bacterium]|nr:adenosylcobinamide-phosphate synthase CbiB [Patulibacter sp.]
MTAAALLLGTGADLALGDPARRHPVAGFGTLVLLAEDRWYRPTRLRGAALTTVGVGATTAIVAVLDRTARHHPATRAALGAAVVWSTLGGRSLWRVADRLAELLESGDIDGARALLPSLAGRDPSALSASELARAGTESVAENTSDAVVGALFYGALLGPAGAAGFRAANTLDAMVGHHSERYERFGWASARFDDLLGYVPSRLGAWLAVLAAPVVGGRRADAARTLLADGSAHPSPNAGQMEAAFAGALGVQLGGPLHYGPRLEERPTLGDGRDPDPRALRASVRLSQAVTALTVVSALALRAGALAASTRRFARAAAPVVAAPSGPTA